MSLRDYVKRFDDGGQVDAPERQNVSRETPQDAPQTPGPLKSKVSKESETVANLANNPEQQASRDARLRAYYEKQLADAQRETEGFGSYTGIDTVLSKYGLSPTGAPNGQQIAAAKMLAQKQAQGATEGLAGLESMKASIASHQKFAGLLAAADEAAAKGDMERSERLRAQAAQLDPTRYGATAEARKLETQSVSEFGKQAADEGLVRGTPEFARRVQELQAEKAARESGKKTQLTDVQRIAAEEKLDEAKGNVESIKGNIAQTEQYATELKNLMEHPGLKKATGSVFGRLPTFRGDPKNFENLLNSVKSKVFLANVTAMKGMGALSNAEGEKIAAAQAALDLTLTPGEMKKQLQIIYDTYDRGVKKQQQLLESGNRRVNQIETVLDRGIPGAAGAPAAAAPGAIPPPAPATPAGAKPAAKKELPAEAYPKAGDIVDGQRFKGGDPRKRENWETV